MVMVSESYQLARYQPIRVEANQLPKAKHQLLLCVSATAAVNDISKTVVASGTNVHDSLAKLLTQITGDIKHPKRCKLKTGDGALKRWE